MEEHSVALKILPSALAKLACSEDQRTLKDLAEKVGMDLKTLMRNYGHHTIAKHLYEGRSSQPNSCWYIGSCWLLQIEGCPDLQTDKVFADCVRHGGRFICLAGARHFEHP